MNTTLVLLLLLSPLAGFLCNVFCAKQLSKKSSGIIGTIAVTISFIVAIVLFSKILQTKEAIEIHLFDWLELFNFKVGFSFLLDQLSLLWLLFVTGIGSLIHLYSISYMADDQNISKFFSYLNLFVFFMIMLVSGSNFLIMFIGWEGVGLCSYLLIGFWYKDHNNNDAAKKAFIMNRIGDLGFLAGIFIVGYLFNSLDFLIIKQTIASGNYVDLSLLGFATLCLFVGATGKSAQIPLYTWLPDAMAGPTPVSALIHAATMVTAGIFMITRLNFLFDITPATLNIIAIIGAITALLAACIALVQNDIKKVLAYSTVSQLGLMFLALGLGAYEVAVFHVITHAFFKGCLFLGSGSVIHAMQGEQDMRYMGGLEKQMKITFTTFLISTLAISGIFPFAGFFSKDEILLTAFHENKTLWIIASLASILTAFYMCRLLNLTFFGKFRGTESQKHHLHESPKLMTFPLIVLAFFATIGGAISIPDNSWLNHYLEPIFIYNREHHTFDTTAIILMIIASVGALIGISLAYFYYIKQQKVPPKDSEVIGFARVLQNKFYVDEIYTFLVVKPIYGLANFFKSVVEIVISAIVFSTGKLTYFISEQGKTLQNGSVGLYLFVFVLGFSTIVYYLFLA